MTLVDRSYPDIVRDVLTNLTQGVSGEVHRVDYDPLARPVVVPHIELLRRPVRRVSVVAGLVAQPGRDEPVPVTFSLNDYELLPDPTDPADLHTIRFLPGGRRPAPGTDVRVNYYPRTTDPTPLTDISVGSVMLERISRVAPPSRNSRQRECPYPPMTRKSADLSAVYERMALPTSISPDVIR